MIPKSGHHFSEKDHAQTKEIERDGESNKNYPSLAVARISPLAKSGDEVPDERHGQSGLPAYPKSATVVGAYLTLSKSALTSVAFTLS
jgi:hypothetical protein